MNRVVSVATRVVIIAAILAVVVPASAQDRRNAATWYRRAIEQIEAHDRERFAPVADYIGQPSLAPSDDVRRAISEAQPALTSLERGALKARCDFELDYSQGFALELPHLGQLRHLGRIMAGRAYVALHDGDSASAARDVGLLYRSSVHLANDRVLISSLVANALWALADGIAEYGFDRGLFNAGDADVMYRALTHVPHHDAFGMTEAVVGEQMIVGDYLANRYGTEEGRAQMLDDLDWMDADDENVQAFTSMTDADFDDALSQYDQLMDQVVVAFQSDSMEDGAADLEAIERNLEDGGGGLLALLFMPAMTKVYERMHDADAKIDARRTMLEGLVEGRIDPANEQNAALFYHAAMEKLREASDEERAALLGAAEPEWTEALKQRHADVLALILEGADKKRCTMRLVRGVSADSVCPPDIAGMREIVSFLLAEADRTEGDERVRAVATLMQFVAHLDDDERIVTSLVIHDAFVRAAKRVRSDLRDERLSDEQLSTLTAAVERIGRSDPFGFLAGIKVTRHRVLVRIYRAFSFGGMEQSVLDQATSDAEAFTGNQLFYLLVIDDSQTRRAVQARDGDAVAGDWARLDPFRALGDLIDPVALDAAHAEADAITARLDEGAYDLFTDHVFLPIAAVDDAWRGSRRDLRQLMTALRRASESEGDAGMDAGTDAEPDAAG